MNKISCAGNIRLFYFSDEYKEDISDMICQIQHLNKEKSFIAPTTSTVFAIRNQANAVEGE